MKKFLIIILIILTASTVFSKPENKVDFKSFSASLDNQTYIDANNILMFVNNFGGFGYDRGGVFGYGYGTFYPYHGVDEIYSGLSSTSPIYNAGIWIGGKVDGGIRVATSEYSTEFVPGPMAEGTFQNDDPSFKVYKLYADSMGTNPNDDYNNWPISDGAPVDGADNPWLIGQQLLWSVFNDAKTLQHFAYGTDPLGVEVQQTVFAASYESNTIYIKYKIYNKGGDQIDSCYFTLWVDPDLGSPGDDLVGCDTLKNMFYVYNDGVSDYDYGSSPPAAGFQFIHGPLVPAPGESGYFESTLVPDYKNLDMSSSFRIINGIDPNDADEVYGYMKGLLGYSASPYIYNGDTLTYECSGDPVGGTGDLDPFSADKRMIGTVGPFDFAPGDSQYVMIRMAVGQGMSTLSSISDLKMRFSIPFNYPTDVDDITPAGLPDRFELAQNYPNPFNPTTTISYRLPTKAKVTLEIFNILGQKVATLIDAEQTAGTHKVEWNGTNEAGDQVTTGVYLYRLSTDKFKQTKKMMLLK